MTERENVIHVLNHDGKAQWLPFWSKCLQIVIPSVVIERPPRGTNGEDWFGCHWIFDPVLGGFVEDPNAPCPLTDITRWREQVRFPDLDQLDWEAGARKDLTGYNREEKLQVFYLESGPLERINQLMGFEESMIAMIEEPEAFAELVEALADYKIAIIEKAMRHYKPDSILTMDDLGTARGPLISTDMYRQLVKPSDARICRAILDQGVFLHYHSCGCIDAFLDDIVEMGPHLITPYQGGINDQVSAQEKYRDKVVFEGCFDNLVRNERSAREDLPGEIKRTLDLFLPHKNIVIYDCMFAANHKPFILEEIQRYCAEHWQ